MPFVTQAHRENPDMTIPGDMCYTFYQEMVRKWKAEPRWTTAHNIYRDMKATLRNAHAPSEYHECNSCAACELAWQVFFQKYVMPYEDKKEAENGTI